MLNVWKLNAFTTISYARFRIIIWLISRQDKISKWCTWFVPDVSITYRLLTSNTKREKTTQLSKIFMLLFPVFTKKSSINGWSTATYWPAKKTKNMLYSKTGYPKNLTRKKSTKRTSFWQESNAWLNSGPESKSKRPKRKINPKRKTISWTMTKRNK